MSFIGWKTHDEILREGLKDIYLRKKGKVKSIKSPWKSFDKIGIDGIEWHSVLGIGARPGVGKTLVMNSLTSGIQERNKDTDIRVLNFQFDMTTKNTAIRELAAKTELDIRYIQSAKDDGMDPLSEEHFEEMSKYVKTQTKREEYTIDTPLTVEQIRTRVRKFHEEAVSQKIAKLEKDLNKQLTEEEKKKVFNSVKLFVSIDHTLLVARGPGEKNQQETLENLSKMLIEEKKKIPVIFVILTQLLRSLDSSERQRPGQLSNFPTEADIYGSDLLQQCADVIIAVNRPAKYHLTKYYHFELNPATDKNTLAFHVLKNRFGETKILWFNARYRTMSLVERPAPLKVAI